MRSNRRYFGATFVETLVAIGLVGMTALAVTVVVIRAVEANMRDLRLTEATQIAERLVEEATVPLVAGELPGVCPSTVTYAASDTDFWVDIDPQRAAYSATVTVTPQKIDLVTGSFVADCDARDLVEVVVNVGWDAETIDGIEFDPDKTVSLTTLVSSDATFAPFPTFRSISLVQSSTGATEACLATGSSVDLMLSWEIDGLSSASDSLTYNVNDGNAVVVTQAELDVGELLIPGITDSVVVRVNATHANGNVASEVVFFDVFRKPSIESLVWDPGSVFVGVPSTLRWRVDGGTSFFLNDESVQSPVGERLFTRPENGAVGRLKAASGTLVGCETEGESAALEVKTFGIATVDLTPTAITEGELVSASVTTDPLGAFDANHHRVRVTAGGVLVGEFALLNFSFVAPNVLIESNVDMNFEIIFGEGDEVDVVDSFTAELTVVPEPSFDESAFSIVPSMACGDTAVTLSWSVSNADSLTLEPVGIDLKDVMDDGYIVLPTTVSGALFLEARNRLDYLVRTPELSLVRSEAVNMAFGVLGSDTISAGGTATLAWRVTPTANNTVTLSVGDWSGPVSAEDQVTVAPLETSTYSLTSTVVDGSGNSCPEVTQDVTINVNKPEGITVNPLEGITETQNANLTWETTGTVDISLQRYEVELVGPTGADSVTRNIDGGLSGVSIPSLSVGNYTATIKLLDNYSALPITYGVAGNPTEQGSDRVLAESDPVTFRVIERPVIMDFKTVPATACGPTTVRFVWGTEFAASVDIDGNPTLTLQGPSTMPESDWVTAIVNEEQVFTLTAVNEFGFPTTRLWTVPYFASGGVLTADANDNTIIAGDSTTLRWQATGSPITTIQEGANAPETVTETGTLTITPLETTTYTLAYGGGDCPIEESQITITVIPVTIDTFTTDPTEVTRYRLPDDDYANYDPNRGTATLEWNVSESFTPDLHTITIESERDGFLPASNTVNVTPVTDPIGAFTGSTQAAPIPPRDMYRMRIMDKQTPPRLIAESESVTVGAAEHAFITAFNATPAFACGDAPITLTWMTRYATEAEGGTVTLNGVSVPAQETTGMNPTVTGTQNFTLVTTNRLQASDSRTIALTRAIAPTITAAFTSDYGAADGDTLTIPEGAPTVFAYEVTNAASLLINDAPAAFSGGWSRRPSESVTFIFRANSGADATECITERTVSLVVEEVNVTNVRVAPEAVTRGEHVQVAWDTSGPFDPALHTVNAVFTPTDGEPIPLNITSGEVFTPSMSGRVSVSVSVPNDDGVGSRVISSESVNVRVVPEPILKSFTVTPAVVCAGGEVTFSWVTQDAVSVALNGDAVGDPLSNPTGSVTRVVTNDTGYHLVISNELGFTSEHSALVRTARKPTGSLTVSEAAIASGGSVLLSWVTQDAERVFLNDAPVSASGTASMRPLEDTRFTLRLESNACGNESIARDVSVTPVSVGAFTVSQERVTAGQDVTFSWTLNNFDARVHRLRLLPSLETVSGSNAVVTPVASGVWQLEVITFDGVVVAVSDPVTVNVVDEPVIAAFNVTPARACAAGVTRDIAWVAEGDSATLTLGASPETVGLTGSTTEVLSGSGVITLTVRNELGFSVQRSNAFVTTAEPVTSLVVPSGVVPVGSTVLVEWESDGEATALVVLDAGASWPPSEAVIRDVLAFHPVPAVGSVRVRVDRDSRVMLVSSNDAGDADCVTVEDAIVRVVVPSVTSFEAEPAVVTAGGSTQLSWLLSDFDPETMTVSLMPGNEVVTGSGRVVSVNESTGYQLVIRALDGTLLAESDVVTVVVDGEPTVTFAAFEPAFSCGPMSSVLSWESAFASSVRVAGVEQLADGSLVLPVPESTSVTLLPVGALGVGAGVVARAVVREAPVIAFEANAASILPGESVRLVWSASNAARVTLDDLPVEAVGERVFTLGSSRSFVLRVESDCGVEERVVSVTVPTVSAASFVSDSYAVTRGDSVTLSWELLNVMPDVHSVTLEPVGVRVDAVGSSVVAPSDSTLFTLVVRDLSGRVVAFVALPEMVQVFEPPVILSFASDATVACGTAPVNLFWSTLHAESVTLDGVPVGAVTGSTARVLTEDATFSLVAVNGAGARAEATVTIPYANAANMVVNSSAATVKAGESVTVSWSSADDAVVRLNNGRVGSSGSVSVTALSRLVFAFEAESGQCGSESFTQVVNVNPVGIESFTVDRSRVSAAGDPVVFSWSLVGFDPTLHALSLVRTSLSSGASVAPVSVSGSSATVNVSESSSFALVIRSVASGELIAVTVPGVSVTLAGESHVTFLNAVPSVACGDATIRVDYFASNASAVSFGAVTLPAFGSFTVNVVGTQTVSLTPVPVGDAVAFGRSVTIPHTVLGEMNFLSSSVRARQGDAVVLSWEPTLWSPDWVTLNDARVPVEGSVTVRPLADARFVLRAGTNAGCVVEESLDVAVDALSFGEFTATPNPVTRDAFVTLELRDVMNFDPQVHELFMDGYGVIPSGGFGEGPQSGVFTFDLSDCVNAAGDSCVIPMGLTDPVFALGVVIEFDGGTLWRVVDHTVTLPDECASTIAGDTVSVDCVGARELLDLGFLTVERVTVNDALAVSFDSSACVNAAVNQTCRLDFVAGSDVVASAFEIVLSVPAGFEGVAFDSGFPSSCETAFSLERVNVVCREERIMRALGGLTLRKVTATSLPPVVTRVTFVTADLGEVTALPVDVGRGVSFARVEYRNAFGEAVDLTRTEGRVPEGIFFADGVLTMSFRAVESKRYQVFGRLRSDAGVVLAASDAVVVRVEDAPRILSFAVTPSTYCVGDSQASVVTWVTEHADTVLLGGFDVTFAGGVLAHHPSGDALTLVARNAVGEVTATVNVALGSVPRVALVASPNPRVAGVVSTVTWVSSGATSTVLDGESVGAFGSRGDSGAVTRSFTLVGSNACGNASHELTLVTIPVVVESFTVDEGNVQEGVGTFLRWVLGSSFNPLLHTVTLRSSGAEDLSVNVTGLDAFRVTPSESTVYSLVITDAVGNVLHESSSVTVTVDGRAAVTSFVAEPAFVCGGGEVVFSWVTRNAVNVTLAGARVTPTSSGSFEAFVRESADWVLVAEDALGRSASASVRLPVVPLPTVVDFSYSPSAPVDGAGGITVSWNVRDASEVRLDDALVAASGSVVVTANASRTMQLQARAVVDGRECIVTESLVIPVTPVTLPTVTLSNSVSVPGTLTYRIFPNTAWVTGWEASVASGVSRTNLRWITGADAAPEELRWLSEPALVEYTGWLFNPTAGEVGFGITHDDEFELIVNDTVTLRKSTVGAETVVNSISLPSGWVNFRARARLTNASGFDMSWRPTGSESMVSVPHEQLGNAAAERMLSWSVSDSFDPALHAVRVSWVSDSPVGERVVSVAFADAGSVVWFAGGLKRVVVDVIRLRDNSVAASVTRTFTAGVNPSVTSFSSSPASVCGGSAVTVSWVSTGLGSTVSFIAESGAVTNVSHALSGNVGFIPNESGVLRVRATGDLGIVTVRDRVVRVTTPPSAVLTVSPTRIKVGEASVLTWSTANAETVLLLGQSVPASGSVNVSPLSTTVYELTTGAGACGNVTRSVTLTVDGVNVTNVTASPARVTLGQSSNVSWSTSGFDAGTHTVVVSGAPAVVTGVGAATVTPESTGNQSVTVSIVDAFGRTIASRTVVIEVVSAAVIDSFTVTPARVCVNTNASTNVTAGWVTRNASSVRINTTTVAPPANATEANIPWRITGGSVPGVTTDTTLTLTATNSLGNTVSAARVIPVTTIPTITFQSDKQQVVWGDTVTLSWSAPDTAVTTLNAATVNPAGSFTTTITETTTFTLVSTVGDCEPVTQHVTINVNQPLVNAFAADRTNVTPSDPTRRDSVLSWGVTHVNTALHDVLLMPDGVNVTGTNSRTVTPASTTTYRIRVTKKNDPNVILTESNGITITTNTDPVITSFASDPATACGITNATLSWVTMNASTATINGVTVTPTAGGNVTRTITQPTVFTLTAVNAAGTSVNRTINVGFATPPITTFTSTKTSIARGETITLSWSTAQATRVLLDGVSVPLSGGTTRAPTSTTTFTLTTQKDGCEDVITPITVTVTNPTITGFTFTGDKDEFGSVPENSTVNLAWGLDGFDAALHQVTLNGVNVSGGTASGLIEETTAFTLRVTDRSTPANLIAERTLTIPVRPVIESFTVTPAVCSVTPTVNVTWVTRHGVTTLTSPTGVATLTAEGTTSRTIDATTTFTLTTTNAVGSSSALEATSTLANAPTITFTVTPENPAPGQTITLAWVVENATGVTLDEESVAASGNRNATAPANAGETVTFTLAASNDTCETVTRTLTVGTETNALTNLTVNPSSVTVGESARVTWSLADGINLTNYRLAINPTDAFGTTDAPADGLSITPTSVGVITITAVLIDRVTNAPISTITTSLTVAPQPTITTFTANPTDTCVSNPTSVLTWNASGGVTYAITQVGTVNATGTRTIDTTASDTWTLTVTNALNKTATSTITTTTHPTPAFSSLVTPASVTLGESIVVSWVGDVSVGVSGAVSVGVPAGSTEFSFTPEAAGLVTFVLTPSNAGCVGESVTRSVLVVSVPDAPSGVSGSVVGDERVQVSWLAPASDGFSTVTNYVVERRTNDLGWLPVATVGNVLEWVDSTVVSGNAYQYRVTARNAVGDSVVSAASNTVNAIRVPAVVACTVTPSAVGSLVVDWVITASAERPVTSFTVTRASDGLERSFAANARSVMDAGLVVGDAVSYTVTASNSAGESEDVCSGIVLGRPGSVTNAVLNASAPEALTLSWGAPTNVGGDASVLTYDVEVRVNPNPAFSVVTSDGVTPSVFAHAAGDTVTYRVRARNPVGAGDWVTTASVLTLGVPVAPSNATLTQGDGFVTAGWVAAASTVARAYDAFDVEWFVDGVSAGVTRTTISAPSAVLTSAVASLGSAVTYRVRSVNTTLGAAFVSAWVNGPSVTLVAAPAAPAVTAAVSGNASVRVEWVPAAGSVARPAGGAFTLQERIDGGSWVSVYSGAERSFNASNLPAGKSAEYRVRDASAVGVSDWSAVAAVTVINAPAALSNCTLNNANGFVTITWSANATAAQPVASVIVRRGNTIITTAGSSPTMDAAAPVGVTVTYSVQPQNAAGLGPTLDCGSITPTLAPDGNATCSSAVGNGSLAFTWSNTSATEAPITSYRVFSDSSGVPGALLQEVTGRTVTISGLTNGVVARVFVTAVGPGGTSPAFTCEGTPYAPPAPVTNCVITPATAGTLNVTWSSAASTTAAPITRTEVTYGTTTIANATAPTTVATTPGETTLFTIRNVGPGGSSANVTCSAASITPPPEATSCTVNALDGGLSVAWTGSSTTAAPITTTRIRVTPAGGSTITREVPFGTNPETILGLTNAAEHDVRVSYGNAIGFGPERSCASNATPTEAPSSPTSCSVTGAGSNALRVDWLHGGADGYRVTFTPSTGAVVTDAVGNVRTVTTSGLTNAVPYVIRVQSLSNTSTWVDGVQSSGGTVASAGWAECTGTPFAVPEAVTSCTVTQSAPQELSVSWTPPTVTSTTPRSAFTVIRNGAAVGDVTGNAFVDSGLTTGTTYTYSVTAVGPGGTANASPSCAATAIDVPNTPSVSVTQSAVGELTVNWSVSSTTARPSGSPTVYQVERSTDRGTTWVSVPGFVEVTTTELVQGGLTLGQRYDYRVRVKNNVGWSGWRSVNADAIGTPNAPRNVTVVASAPSELTVSWSAPSSTRANPSGFAYRVERSITADGPWTMVRSEEAVGSGNRSFIDRNVSLTDGGYHYRIQNFNEVGGGTWSNPEYGMPLSVPRTTGAPSCSTVSGSSISVAWMSSMFSALPYNAPMWFEVEWETSANVTPKTGVLPRTTSYSLVHSGLSAAQFRYRVRGGNEVGAGDYGSWSNWCSLLTPPGTPRITSARATGRNAITVKYASVSGATSYDLEWRRRIQQQNSQNSAPAWGSWTPSLTNVTSLSPQVGSLTSRATASTTPGVSSCYDYQFRVRAVNSGGPGEWSEPSVVARAPHKAPMSIDWLLSAGNHLHLINAADAGVDTTSPYETVGIGIRYIGDDAVFGCGLLEEYRLSIAYKTASGTNRTETGNRMNAFYGWPVGLYEGNPTTIWGWSLQKTTLDRTGGAQYWSIPYFITMPAITVNSKVEPAYPTTTTIRLCNYSTGTTNPVSGQCTNALVTEWTSRSTFSSTVVP